MMNPPRTTSHSLDTKSRSNISPLPSNYELVYSPEQIAAACRRLGGLISDWIESFSAADQQPLLTVPILRGGLFFYADLTRQLRASVDLLTASSAAYDVSSNSLTGESVTAAFEKFEARGRRILLVDDVCDSGKTLAAMKSRLLDRGASDVRTAVLVRRIVPGAPHQPDYIGFDYAGSEWFVGYGMDDRGAFRNLDGVYRMAGKAS